MKGEKMGTSRDGEEDPYKREPPQPMPRIQEIVPTPEPEPLPYIPEDIPAEEFPWIKPKKPSATA